MTISEASPYRCKCEASIYVERSRFSKATARSRSSQVTEAHLQCNEAGCSTMAQTKRSKRAKAQPRKPAAGKRVRRAVGDSEAGSVDQATREFLARDEKLAEESKRRLEAA